MCPEVAFCIDKHRILDISDIFRHRFCGIALLRAAATLNDLALEGDQETGLNIIRRSLLSPVRAIAENAGMEGSVVVAKVQAGEGNYGFNAATTEYGDMLEDGVVDPQASAPPSRTLQASQGCS